MKINNSTDIARAIIKRYGLQAQAMADEQAEIMSRQDPGSRHVWDGVSSAVTELRRTSQVQNRVSSKGA
jgi:hypothetical protein